MKGIILRYYTRLFLRDFLLSLLTIYLHFMIMKSTQHFREPNSFWKIGVPSYTLCLIMWINYSRLYPPVQLYLFCTRTMQSLKLSLDGESVTNVNKYFGAVCHAIYLQLNELPRNKEMEESNSPVLSCKKSNKKCNVHLLESPVFSSKRKKQKQLPDDDSPVFLPSTRRTTRRCNEEEPLVIENFWSPPSKKSSPASCRRLMPKSLFVDETPPLVDLSQTSSPSSQRTVTSSQTFIEEDSQSDQGCEDDELPVIHERTLSDTEDIALDVTSASVAVKIYCCPTE